MGLEPWDPYPNNRDEIPHSVKEGRLAYWHRLLLLLLLRIMAEGTASLAEILHAIELWESDRNRIREILEHSETSTSPLDPLGWELLLQELVVAQSQITYLHELEQELLKREA